MWPWQLEFKSNKPKNLTQPFPLPDDALHERTSDTLIGYLPTDFRDILLCKCEQATMDYYYLTRAFSSGELTWVITLVLYFF